MKFTKLKNILLLLLVTESNTLLFIIIIIHVKVIFKSSMLDNISIPINYDIGHPLRRLWLGRFDAAAERRAARVTLRM